MALNIYADDYCITIKRLAYERRGFIDCSRRCLVESGELGVLGVKELCAETGIGWRIVFSGAGLLLDDGFEAVAEPATTDAQERAGVFFEVDIFWCCTMQYLSGVLERLNIFFSII